MNPDILDEYIFGGEIPIEEAETEALKEKQPINLRFSKTDKDALDSNTFAIVASSMAKTPLDIDYQIDDKAYISYCSLFRVYPLQIGIIIKHIEPANIVYFLTDKKGFKVIYYCGRGFLLKKETILISVPDYINSTSIIYHKPGDREEVVALRAELLAVDKPKKSKIGFVVSNDMGLSIQSFDFPKISHDINLNNNDDFIEVDKSIREFIKSDDSGLCLISGQPGGGKSFYLKSLINSEDKNFIYLGKDAIELFCSPSFVGFALNNLKNSVLIIEDAEEILMEESRRNGSTVNVLNLTDGILADIVKLKIIATFNCPVNKLDAALLRKGRLKMKYEFKLLTVEKTNKLLEHLGHSYRSHTEMSLADIYNLTEENGNRQPEVKKLGF